jgi:guanosine-diphosphatase
MIKSKPGSQDRHRNRARSTTPETDSVATTTSSSRYPTRQSSPTPDNLRARTTRTTEGSKMFSTRKYTPLPTSANGAPRKRSGGGMSAWKRWILVGGGITLVVVALGGYHGVGRSGGQMVGFEDDS